MAVSSSTVEGRLEGVFDGHVEGWAWLPENPDASVRVTVMVDGETVAETVAEADADLLRPSLRDAGIGNGAHGFRIELPADELPGDGVPHTLAVHAGPTGAMLAPSPRFEVSGQMANGGSFVPASPRPSTRAEPGWAFSLGPMLADASVGLADARAWIERTTQQIPPALRGRVAFGLFTSLLVVTSLMSSPLPVSRIVDPVGDAGRFVSDVHLSLSGGAQEREVRSARATTLAALPDPVPANVLAAVSGGCVAVEPYQVSIVWLYQLRWCPVPAMQSYNATTSHLDELDAAAYRDARTGPSAILRQTGAIFSHNASWESPAAIVAMVCNFAEAARGGSWQALVRVPDRCGKQVAIGTMHVSLGRIVRLPQAPAGDLEVADVGGLGVTIAEQVSSLFGNVAMRHIFIGPTSWRISPDTPDDGILLNVPPDADYAPPFNEGLSAHSIGFEIDGDASGEVTVHLYGVPITALPVAG